MRGDGQFQGPGVNFPISMFNIVKQKDGGRIEIDTVSTLSTSFALAALQLRRMATFGGAGAGQRIG
jgi:hypothetical protein